MESAICLHGDIPFWRGYRLVSRHGVVFFANWSMGSSHVFCAARNVG